MITPKLAIVAVGIVRDTDTTAVSIFNVLDSVSGAGFPFFIQQLAFYVLWHRTADDPENVVGTFTLSLNDNVLIQNEVRADFVGGLKNQMLIRVGGVLVTEPGRLRFVSELQTGARAEYEIEVTAGPPAVQVQGAPAVR